MRGWSLAVSPRTTDPWGLAFAELQNVETNRLSAQ